MAAVPEDVASRVTKPEPQDGGDAGLNTLARILDRHGVAFWVDSGVLLGLVRSGRLNPWEKDVDLAVMGDQVEALLAALPALEAIGYSAGINRYRGTIFSVSLRPSAGMPEGTLRAAIHVYYEVGDHLWSPQVQLYVPPPVSDVYLGRRSLVGSLLCWLIRQRLYRGGTDLDAVPAAEKGGRDTRRRLTFLFAQWFYRSFDKGVLAETWPVREIFVPLTWVIPKNLVLPLGSLKVGGNTYRVPVSVDGYLSHRYGDWKVPQQKWCYWEDDGAIVRERPFDVRKRLLNE